MSNLYLDFHVLQTVPPSCVNRDDTGSPKTALFGGKTRARVSSQAWKHAMRNQFKEILSSDNIGYRTRNIKKLLVDKVCELNKDITVEQSDELVKNALKAAKLKGDDDKKDVLFFISSKQIEEFAKTILKLKDDTAIKDKEKEKLYKEALNGKPSVDLVMFGRMAANDPNLNFDAAAQVAHSISTHAVSNEYDYFTAVDDYVEDDNSGAGHLGTVEFNSSTLYRYATVNVNELLEHLNKEESLTAVKGFAEAFIKAMPTGKQNTFANRTLPDMVYITIRTDQPVNMVNAFEKPVVSGENGYVDASKKAFIEYVKTIYTDWVSSPVKEWHIGRKLDELGEAVNYPEMIDAVVMELGRLIDK